VGSVAVTRAVTFVCGGLLLVAYGAEGYGSRPALFDFLRGPTFLGFVGSGIAWLVLRERERLVVSADALLARRARLWALGAAVCFACIGWSWTGGAPRPVSPTLCFGGALVCAIGALVTARDARESGPRARASARAAAGLAVGLALVPLLLFGLVVLLFITSHDPLQ
jgi:hypothetical protein